MDQENEVSKIFIISLRLIERTEKAIFKVSRPYSKVRPAKLTNHSVRTERYYKKHIVGMARKIDQSQCSY